MSLIAHSITVCYWRPLCNQNSESPNLAFGLFKRKDHPQPEPVDTDVTIASPAEAVADEEEKTAALRATGIDVEETVDQLQKFSKIHKWV